MTKTGKQFSASEPLRVQPTRQLRLRRGEIDDAVAESRRTPVHYREQSCYDEHFQCDPELRRLRGRYQCCRNLGVEISFDERQASWCDTSETPR